VAGHEAIVDRLTRSHRNSFTSVRLDRLVERRDDPQWVRTTLRLPGTRILPMWRGRGLINPDRPGEEVIYLEHGALAQQSARLTLLGRDSEHHYFALPVDDPLREQLLEAQPGAAFHELRRAAIGVHEKHAGILAYAKAMLYWQYRNAFCGFCGSANRAASAGHRLKCLNPDCGRESFPRIDPSIIVLVTHGDACLLGRNARWPERRFSALAGYVEPGESLEDAVTREVYEESGVRLSSLSYVSSQPWPFPSSAMCGFYAEAASRNCAPTEEIEELRWFTAAGLASAIENDEIRVPPPVSIAFQLISDWFERQGGGPLEPLLRASGSWIARKGIK
jgi:NAD+ diphosphatase